MTKRADNPRILIVTPEVTYLPEGMGNLSNYLSAKAGGMADVSSVLIAALYDQGADVHVALPDFRGIFRTRLAPILGKEIDFIRSKMPGERVHLAEDRAFFYQDHVYSDYHDQNIKVALAFQREVINNIIPRVQPDLIHCNDWMTGLIPGLSRRLNIPCLFTLHNIHTKKCLPAEIEDRGIDVAEFWQHLFFEHYADNYASARHSNRVDLLTSAVFGAHFVNTVSPTFLDEMAKGYHSFVYPPLREELANKVAAGCAVGILNGPDPSFNPRDDAVIHQTYGPDDHGPAKRANKLALQNELGLVLDENAPIFFWPHRLDPIQKGCQLLAEILFQTVSDYWEHNLQVVFVANGDFKRHFTDITSFHGIHDRVAVCDFDEDLARKVYAAADFMLMPSRFEPCGLPQMIAPIYGALPVAHDTGGIHDTVFHLDIPNNRGNGFLFTVYDAPGLRWAMDEALRFHFLEPRIKEAQITRIMTEAKQSFSPEVSAKNYIDLYEKMLQRPLINPDYS